MTRDEQIVDQFLLGVRMSDIALKFNLSRQGVTNILDKSIGKGSRVQVMEMFRKEQDEIRLKAREQIEQERLRRKTPEFKLMSRMRREG